MKQKTKTLLALLLSAALSLTACAKDTPISLDEPVLRIDGQDILKSEYMVHLYTVSAELVSSAGEAAWEMDFDGQTADELVEAYTITTLQNLVAAEEYAAENEISLTEEERKEAAQAAEAFLSSISAEDLAKMGVDQEKMTAIMEASYLYSAVTQAICAEYEIENAKIEDFFTENKAGLMEAFRLLRINSIVVEDLETAEEVLEKANAGEDFSALFDDYDTVGTMEGEDPDGEMTIYRYILESQYGLSADAAVGDIAGPFHMGSTYFILKIAEELTPEEAEVKKMAGEVYRSNMQTMYAEKRMAALIADQSIEKIEGAWDASAHFHE